MKNIKDTLILLHWKQKTNIHQHFLQLVLCADWYLVSFVKALTYIFVTLVQYVIINIFWDLDVYTVNQTYFGSSLFVLYPATFCWKHRVTYCLTQQKICCITVGSWVASRELIFVIEKVCSFSHHEESSTSHLPGLHRLDMMRTGMSTEWTLLYFSLTTSLSRTRRIFGTDRKQHRSAHETV